MKKFGALLFAFLLLVSCAAFAEEDTVFDFSAGSAATGESAQSADEKTQQEESGVPWTFPIAREILDDPDGVLILVNKDNLLEKSYPDQSTLVTATVRKASSSKMQGRDIAYAALEKMFAGAEADGIKLYLKSAYRTYRTQEVMHYNRVQKLGYDDGVVQEAGASEHQTGMAFDVICKSFLDKKMSAAFDKTDEGKWLAAHCAEYGFIIRYLEGKEDITGIAYEPYHFRYVGVEVATYMMANNLTLEEFTAEARRAITLYDAGMDWDTPLEPVPQPEQTFEAETDDFTF